MEIIGLIIVGLIVGALGRLVNPGRDPMGLILTMAIGVAAVLLVYTLLVDGWLGFIIAVIVAAVLVTVFGRLWPGGGECRGTGLLGKAQIRSRGSAPRGRSLKRGRFAAAVAAASKPAPRYELSKARGSRPRGYVRT